ncbi:hypothetical protein KUTeg_017132 [Tegillarca granosa]|uniref:Uncharacterized protein n=1 Tax=Tegillarca granosa TaxID=220873 RepID=A0ABQ9ERL5_TEGGR|nr:hypothetical protein KUTeg_017132 [Tegillarca granosa]
MLAMWYLLTSVKGRPRLKHFSLNVSLKTLPSLTILIIVFNGNQRFRFSSPGGRRKKKTKTKTNKQKLVHNKLVHI